MAEKVVSLSLPRSRVRAHFQTVVQKQPGEISMVSNATSEARQTASQQPKRIKIPQRVQEAQCYLSKPLLQSDRALERLRAFVE